MVNTILARRVNHIVAKGGNPVWPKGSKSRGFSNDREIWRVKYGHDLKNIRRAEIVLNLDCIQRGLGNASCGPGPRPQYEIKKNTDYRMAFRIEKAH